MKRIIYLMVMLLVAGNLMATNLQDGEIVLTESKDDTRNTKPKEVLNPGSLPGARSLSPQSVYAYLFNNVISLDFVEPCTSATVILLNEATGEVVLAEDYDAPASLQIDLSGKSHGTYKIEITSESFALEGRFSY